MSAVFEPRAGAVRYTTLAGEKAHCNPQEPFYSTAIMMAEEYWDIERAEWVPIFENDEGEAE